MTAHQTHRRGGIARRPRLWPRIGLHWVAILLWAVAFVLALAPFL